MSSSRLYVLFVAIGIILTPFSCIKENSKYESHPAFWSTPSGFPEPIYLYSSNPKKAEVFELGRKLFYDPIISIDSSIACVSCHHQHLAFSDSTAFSTGVNNKLGLRNSPALINLAWQPHFMWDGGINHIEVMPLAPITDSLEMAIPFKDLLNRLNQNEYYKKEFQLAWGTDSISDQTLLWSLTQFIAALISSDSPFDQYKKGNSSALQTDQIQGMKLFENHCSSCHQMPLFTTYRFANNGTYQEGKDPGREIISQKLEDRGKFKIPSLRNIAFTAPYMHDGRYKTLEDVLIHYTSTIAYDLSVDKELKGAVPLTNSEQKKIISFLHSLSDQKFIHNTYFSNPR
ncbi:cytochrome c peroxidase [soil metagenome]